MATYQSCTYDYITKDEIKQYLIEHEEIMYNIAVSLIGCVVRKKGNKPFKSTFKHATVTGVVRNPHTNKWAVTFLEDDSCVEVNRLTKI